MLSQPKEITNPKEFLALLKDQKSNTKSKTATKTKKSTLVC